MVAKSWARDGQKTVIRRRPEVARRSSEVCQKQGDRGQKAVRRLSVAGHEIGQSVGTLRPRRPAGGRRPE